VIYDQFLRSLIFLSLIPAGGMLIILTFSVLNIS